MKGISLGPNVLVLLVLAIILLAAILSLFMTQWGSGSETLDLQAEHSRLCNLFVLSGGCDTGDTDEVKTDLDNDPSTIETLTDVCAKIGINGKVACARSCGC